MQLWFLHSAAFCSPASAPLVIFHFHQCFKAWTFPGKLMGWEEGVFFNCKLFFFLSSKKGGKKDPKPQTFKEKCRSPVTTKNQTKSLTQVSTPKALINVEILDHRKWK